MIKQSELTVVYEEQNIRLKESSPGLSRELLTQLPIGLERHALIISGIRRCGKSTLLNQLIRLENEKDTFFLNFDTPKLYNFEIRDFEILDNLIIASGKRLLYFDEIQVVEGWELYVRQKLDQGYPVVIIGSNASLLSRELGTKLTGRHLTKELFPFSFLEYAAYRGVEPDENVFNRYMQEGGFPEYLHTTNPDLLVALLEDILYRDIAVRYNIRNVKSLQHLILFLASNTANLVTATKMTQSIGIKSAATVLDYFSYFEQSYLLRLMPKFSYSYRAQLVNPKKIYFIDTGLLNAISLSLGENEGRMLENIVFWELYRRGKTLYYYNENGRECDFVVCRGKKPEQLIQVCYSLNSDNQSREERALIDAMDYFKFDKGYILTLNQKDLILHQGKRIEVVPVSDFLVNNKKEAPPPLS